MRLLSTKKLLAFFIFSFFSNLIFAQSPVASFHVKNDVCKNEQFLVSNASVNATTYDWDFCETDLSGNTTFTPRGIISGELGSVDFRLKFDGSEWYGFLCDADGNKFSRIKFGNSPNNAPQAIENLTNISVASAVEIFKHNGMWYGFLSNFSSPTRLLLFQFGASLGNPNPVIQEVSIPPGILNNSRTIRVVEQDGEVIVFVTNASLSKISRLNFGANLTTTILESSTIETGFFNMLGMDVTIDNGNRFMVISAPSNNVIFKLNFGTSWKSQPSLNIISTGAVSLSNPGLLKIEQEGGKYFCLLMEVGGRLIKMNFGNSFAGLSPAIENISTFSEIKDVYGLDVIRLNGQFKMFLTTYRSNRLAEITFSQSNCSASIPNFSSENPPRISFTDEGSKPITLRVSGSGITQDVVTKYVNVLSFTSPPINFTFTNKQCNGLPNEFQIDNGVYSSINWDFADGTTSTSPNPTHSFLSTGLFSVKLTTTDNNNCVSVKENTVNIFRSTDFAIPFGNICTNQAYVLSNLTDFDANDSPLWQWFVDNQPVATSKDTEITFTETSSKTIKLRAENNQCVSEISKLITPNLTGPQVNFTTNGQCQNSIVDFQSQITGDYTNLEWNFGDGSISNTVSANKIFTNSGIYEITLQVNGSQGCQNSVTKQLQVFSQPSANFMTELPPFSCTGTPTQFTDLTPNPTDSNLQSWLWTFAPGQTSTTKNPTFTYQNAGLVPVSLSVTTNKGCTNSITKDVTIAASPTPQITNAPICFNQPVLFNANVGNATDWFWQIGNSFYFVSEPVHVFANTGNVNASVVVTANNGCVASVFKEIVVPVPAVTNFTASKTCAGLPGEFTATATLGSDVINNYEWNFDGEIVTGQNVLKTFPSIGTKIITVSAIGQSGCRYEATKAIQVVAAPVPMFTASPDRGRPPLSVQFTNTSQQSTSYLWRFNDANNSISTVVSPTFVFDQLGDYPVDLIARNDAGCEATQTKIIQVLIPRLSVSINNFELIKNNDGTYNANVILKNDGNLPAENVSVALKSGSGFRLILPVGTVAMGNAQSFLLSASILPNEQIEYVCAEIVLPENEAITNLDACDLLSLPFTAPAPYPNPAQNKIIQDFIAEENSQNTSVSIHNAQGKEVYQNTIDTIIGLNRLEIDVQNWATGIYTIKITATGYQKSFKVAIIQ